MKATQLLALVVSLLIPTSESDELALKQSRSLTHIGNVGNKQFFIGDFEYNWYVARELCTDSSMDLVEIQSMEEVSFLNKTLTERDEFSHYWTSAKAKYVFETTNTVFDPQFGDIDYSGTPLCLSMRVPGDPTQWDVRMCDEGWPALCQQTGDGNTSSFQPSSTQSSFQPSSTHLQVYYILLPVAIMTLQAEMQ